MIETFVALAFAHILADYVFQPAWMVQRKKRLRNSAAAYRHARLCRAR